MPNDLNNVTPLDRYVALRTLRDNAFYQKPLAYNALDFADDLPGSARGASLWFSDFFPSLGAIERDPVKRKEQISKALIAAKASKDSRGDAARQAFSNALTLGVSGAPVSAATSAVFRLLGPRSPFARGKLRSPFSLKSNVSRVKTNPVYRKKLLKEILADSMAGGIFSATSGALTPLVAAWKKPSDSALEGAGKFLESAPVAGALPGGDILHALTADKPFSRSRNIALGAGLGGALGAVGAFVPAALNIPEHLITGILKRRSPIGNIIKDFSNSATKQIPRNVALLTGAGALGGGLLPNTTDHEQI